MAPTLQQLASAPAKDGSGSYALCRRQYVGPGGYRGEVQWLVRHTQTSGKPGPTFQYRKKRQAVEAFNFATGTTA